MNCDLWRSYGRPNLCLWVVILCPAFVRLNLKTFKKPIKKTNFWLKTPRFLPAVKYTHDKTNFGRILSVHSIFLGALSPRPSGPASLRHITTIRRGSSSSSGRASRAAVTRLLNLRCMDWPRRVAIPRRVLEWPRSFGSDSARHVRKSIDRTRTSPQRASRRGAEGRPLRGPGHSNDRVNGCRYNGIRWALDRKAFCAQLTTLPLYQHNGFQSTRTHSNSFHAKSYPSQLVPNTKSYPDQLVPTYYQLVPKPSRTQYQLVPEQHRPVESTELLLCNLIDINTVTKMKKAPRETQTLRARWL